MKQEDLTMLDISHNNKAKKDGYHVNIRRKTGIRLLGIIF